MKQKHPENPTEPATPIPPSSDRNQPICRKVLECASPLALSIARGIPRANGYVSTCAPKSGRGLPHSKTLSRGRKPQFQTKPNRRRTTFAKGRLALLLAVSALLTGCASTRPIGDAVLGAGGGLLGHELSNGKPIATAAGAAGGVLLSEGLHYLAGRETRKAYASGYDKGKSDAVKQQYWLQVALQQPRNRVSNVRLYPVQLPEQHIDGVIYQPSTKYFRIEE